MLFISPDGIVRVRLSKGPEKTAAVFTISENRLEPGFALILHIAKALCTVDKHSSRIESHEK